MARVGRNVDWAVLDEGFTPRARGSLVRIVVSVLLCATVAGVWTLNQPASYRASCIIRYAADPASNGSGAENSQQEWYNTQEFLLASHSVAERAAQIAHLDTDGRYLGVGRPGKIAPRAAEAARRLRENTSIERVPHTQLARIVVSDAQAQRAADIANAIAEGYLERTLADRMSAAQHARGWLADQIRATTERLQSVEGELQTQLKQSEAPAMPVAEQQQLINVEVRQLNQALTEARVQRIFAMAQVSKLKAAQRDNPFDVHTREVDQNEEVKRLRAERDAITLKLRVLAADVAGPARELEESRVSSLQDQAAAVLNGILQSAQAELTSAQNIETQLQSALAQSNAAARKLQLDELTFGRLERERAETAARLKNLQEQVDLVGLSGSAGATSGQVMERAFPPAGKEPLPIARNVALSGVLGLILAALLKRLGV
ncbi:MAG: Tyrosine-protein kinase EpsD [Myxococcaceae bacterium]|nr:Tyrosine-protein kinase EpsD [Myxococcaceae bacterium]